ncbi:MAG: hypothetical protein ABFD97_01680, partial [Syntrophobacter sp.]
NPDIAAVSSHLARPPLPWPECLPILFLRHPILRAQSVYNFTRTDASQPFHDVAREESFAGFVRWALDSRGGVVIRDYQVTHLSDASFRDDCILDARTTPEDLEQACDLLGEWGLVGIVESYAASAELIQRAYGPRLPELNFEVTWQNRTQTVVRTLDEQLDKIRASLGQPLFNELVSRNSLDLALYQFGLTLFNKVCKTYGIGAESAIGVLR